MKKKAKNKKKIIIITIIIVAIIAVIIRAITANSKVEEVKPEIEKIEKRTIAQSISSTGVIKAHDTKEVVSTLTGMKITSINVKEGDKISAGDVICTFDTSTIENNLNDLQKSVSVTNAQNNLGLQGARRSLNDAIVNRDTQVSVSQKDVDNAASAYNNAKKQLEEAKKQVTNSNGNLSSLQNAFNAESAKFNPIKIEYDRLQSDFSNKETAYNAQAAKVAAIKAEQNTYFDEEGNPKDPANLPPQYVTEQANLVKAEAELKTAESAYLNYKIQYDQAEASYIQIKNQYEAASQGTQGLQGNIANLEANVSNLKSAYDATVTAYNSAVNNANSQVASLQDNVSSQELASSIGTQSQATQIKELKKQLDEGNLKATVSGTVTKVNVKTGDIYSGTSIATIEGCEDFIVEAEIDEYDIADIKEGMKVLIKTDATRDEELEGKVIYTAVSATNSAISATGMTGTATGSNATYTVKISLDTPNDRLRLGMNAKLSIITEMKENVWTVPYDSVYTRDDGTKYIEIAKDEEGNEKEELDVETGTEGTYYIEIISDKLKEGMKVVLPEVDAGNSIENLIEMMGADAGI